MAALDLVDWPADRTLALSGSAGALRIPITLRNDSTETAQVTEALLTLRRAGDAPLQIDPLAVQVSVGAGGTGRTKLRLRLDPATPPGRYEGQMAMGGLTRSVSIDVLPDVKLTVRPAPVIIDAAQGLRPIIAVAFENQGNVPLALDLKGQYPLVEEALAASDRLDRVSPAENPLAAVFDRMVGRAPVPVLLPFGVLELTMPSGPAALEPGASAVVEVALKLPPNLAPSARYHSFVPVYATELHIVVVTAAKAHGLAGSPRTTGASA